MKTQNVCQSCGMPVESDQAMGTEKDGSLSKEYCKNCYKDGTFSEPELTVKQMSTKVSGKMKEMKMDSAAIDLAVGHLSELKRWNQKEKVKVI